MSAKKLTAENVTDDVKASVRAYLMARAHAETMRAAVDNIQRDVLTGWPLYNDLAQEHGDPVQRITDPERVYLSQDADGQAAYYAEADTRIRAAGLKPDDMALDYCPALVAEHLQSKAESVLVWSAASMMDQEKDEFYNGLLGLGMEKFKKFVGLVVSLVISLPDWDRSQLAI